jgi:GNAT superfamily N-acetyltransferase
MRLNLPGHLALRPVGPADQDTLLAIYASTREEELARTDWSAEQKSAFVAMQFQAQTAHYTANYPGAEFFLVLVAGEPAGRLYLHRRAGDLRIMDIALLPAHRGQGIGTAVLGALQAMAAAEGIGLSIHVETFNPARRLYERLGFRPAAEAGVYILMQWAAESSVANLENAHEHA